MRGIIKKWGNSAAVRIPSGILKAARLEVEDMVDLREEGGQIIIKPVRPAKLELAQLIAEIKPDNLHPGVDAGAPVGKESL
jgi:antitoxin MazE